MLVHQRVIVSSTTGWWYAYPSENMKVSWDYYSPMYGKIKNVPNHQPVYIIVSSTNTAW